MIHIASVCTYIDDIYGCTIGLREKGRVDAVLLVLSVRKLIWIV